MDALTVSKAFKRAFQSEPQILAYAPGRVNLIGDHTDYNHGFVLPAAIDMGTFIAANKRDDNEFHVIANDINGEKICFGLGDICFDEPTGWGHYVKGVIQALIGHLESVENHSTRQFAIQGCDLLISGTLPQGAGLSSSASLEVALIKAMSELFDLHIDGVSAALIGQQAENVYVGCNCGIMDQLISALGQDSQAMLLDCHDLSYRYASIPNAFQLVIIDSKVKRQLVGSEYNERRQQCDYVAEFFNQSSLRGVSLRQLETAKSDLPALLYRRARHVLTENERTLRAYQALELGNMALISQLMQESHVSLKEDFEVTTVEIDYLVSRLSSVIGESGGVRMTGGGFGGCVIALVPYHLLDTVKTVVERDYSNYTGLKADIYVCSAKAGAFS